MELLASELLSDGELAVMGGGFRFLGMAPRDLLSRGTWLELSFDVFEMLEDDLSSIIAWFELDDEEELLLKKNKIKIM